MNLTVSDGIDLIINSSISDTDKAECFDLLVKVFIKKSVSRYSDIERSKFFHFKTLEKAGLIIESSITDEKKWIISNELINLNLIIRLMITS